MSKETVINTHAASISGLEAFVADATNPAIVEAARLKAQANVAGVQHVAERKMHSPTNG